LTCPYAHPEIGVPGRANPAKQSQLAPGRCRARTPNPRRAKGQSCETKPNLGELGCLGDRTGGQAQGKCAKQTQLAAERREEQVLYGQRVMVNWTSTGLRRNKANSRRCRGGRRLRGRRRGQSRQTKPIPGNRPDRVVGCTNKPNSCHYADPEIGVPRRAYCAKQSQLAPGRCRARTPNPRRAKGQSCKTKPIWANLPPYNRLEWCQTKPIARSGAPGRCPPVTWTRWTWNRQLRAERGNPPPYAGPTPRGLATGQSRCLGCRRGVDSSSGPADTKGRMNANE
jgi:hypothetical protein